MYVHWSLDPKPKIFEYGSFKAYATPFRVFLSLLSSLQPLFLCSVISTLIWVPWPQIFESEELFWNFQGLDFSSSVSYRLWNLDFTYPILSPSFFSFISLKFSVHGSAPTSYNLPPPLYYSLKSLDSASWYYSHHFCEYVHLPGLLLLPSKI